MHHVKNDAGRRIDIMNYYQNTRRISTLNKYLISFLFLLLGTFSILQAETKIMPLGDSLTWDWHYNDGRNDAERSGYRNYLWYQLQDGGYNVNFVGSRSNGGAVRPSYDGNNEGYTGWTSHQIADKVYSFLDKNTPDIILLHIGTNDIIVSPGAASAEGVERILDEIDRFEKNRGVKIKVILARIVSYLKDPSWTSRFNSNLVTMAQNRIDSGDDIILVDMENGAGIDYGRDMMPDGIHPNNTGYSKMAGVWFKTLKENIKDHAWLVPIYGILLSS